MSSDERFNTVTQIGGNACFAAVGGLSLLIVLIGGDSLGSWAGLAYFLLGPVLTVYYTVMGARRRKLTARR